MLKHPSFVPSLVGTTIFSSSTDGIKGVYQWKEHPFFDYYFKLENLLNIRLTKLRNVSSHMRPIELHMQSLCELLNNQKKHYKDPINHEKSIPTKSQYLKSFGLDLSLGIEELFDQSETSFRPNEHPKHWFSVLPAEYIEKDHELDSRFDRLVNKSFNLLKKHWVERGYMDEAGNLLNAPTYKFNVVSKNTLGKDVGAKSAPYLLLRVAKHFGFFKSHPNRDGEFLAEDVPPMNGPHLSDYSVSYIPDTIPSTDSLYSINQSLATYGIAVVRKVFTKEQIKQVKRMLHVKTTLARETAFNLLEADPNVSAMKYTRGRINCILRGTSFNELLSPLQSFWMPIVYYNMKSNRSFFLSNLQLVLSDRLSHADSWHRGNRHFGLNVLVPLDDVDVNGGRMQFLTGTQNDSNKIFSYEIGPSGVDLEVGDILIFNSTVLHRNTINETNVCRSALIFTYDHTDTPPPGQGAMRFLFDRVYGNFIVGINKIFY